MSTPTSPSVPTRSNTVRSSWTGTVTRRNTDSEDEAIPNSDSSEVCLVFRKYVDPQTDKQTTNLLVERLRAWKHMCGYLEDYVSATAKVQKSQSKDYEKVLKVC